MSNAQLEWVVFLAAISFPLLIAYAGAHMLATGYPIWGMIVICIAILLFIPLFWILAPGGRFGH